MKLHRLAVLGTTTAAGIAMLAAPATAGPRHPEAKTHPARTLVISSCTKKRFEPKNYVLTCADGYATLNHATYTKWGAKRATGNATYVFNTCKPTCVAGTDKTKAVTFVLKDAQLVNGRELFSKIVLKYGTHTRHYSLPTSTI